MTSRPTSLLTCWPATALLTAALCVACSTSLIPNTDVPDTAQNREVVTFVERYRHALEARSIPLILEVVSERYLDGNGTLSPEDDRDYDQLREELTALNDRLLDVRYEMRYRNITYLPDRILVDYTYTGNFKVATADGDRWTRRLADNRLELVRSADGLRIVSGM